MTQSNEILALERFDTDGALQETGGELDGSTRGAFFKRAGVAAASLAGTSALMGGLPSLAMGASGIPKSDVAILNFALTLEFLEAEFYKQASDHLQGANGVIAEFASLVAEHEQTHVTTLRKVLGSKAVKKPTFDFGKAVTDPDTFVKTAFVLENTGVHAYLGQAGKIKTPALLGAAATIVTVEARHAAAIALVISSTAINGKSGITPDGAFDVPKSKAAILSAVKKTGFIKG
ncbi:MAG TPA: ferritin-like domain-containing protein [Casimicrobiaceae bacterium]